MEQILTDLLNIYNTYEGNISTDFDTKLADAINRYECESKIKVDFLVKTLREIDRDLHTTNTLLETAQANNIQLNIKLKANG